MALVMIGCLVVGAIILFSAYMRLTGAFRPLFFDQITDFLVLGTIGLALLALPLLRIRELKEGYSAVLSPDSVEVVMPFRNRFVRWEDIVDVQVRGGKKRAIRLLRRRPSGWERLLTTDYTVVVPLQFAERSIGETLQIMIAFHPSLRGRISCDIQKLYL
nr:PH domain-containing protein [Notoacmeibacter sp. MSK16QG-6]